MKRDPRPAPSAPAPPLDESALQAMLALVRAARRAVEAEAPGQPEREEGGSA